MAATFGAVVAVFQWGWLADLIGVEQTGPIISLLPIFLIGMVFGLAMDYQVFLVTRMREDARARRRRPRRRWSPASGTAPASSPRPQSS